MDVVAIHSVPDACRTASTICAGLPDCDQTLARQLFLQSHQIQAQQQTAVPCKQEEVLVPAGMPLQSTTPARLRGVPEVLEQSGLGQILTLGRIRGQVANKVGPAWKSQAGSRECRPMQAACSTLHGFAMHINPCKYLS